MEEEFLMLGLRMNSGINLIEYNNKFNSNFLKKYSTAIKELKELYLIDLQNDQLSLTEKGLDLCDSVVLKFIEQI